MKNSILTFITLFSLTLLISCGGDKGKENQAEASTENAETGENTETGTAESRLDMSKPCDWVSADFVKSTFELGDEVKVETQNTSDDYGNIGCEYNWSDKETGYFGTISITFGGKAATYESAKIAEERLYSSADIAEKGVTSEVETDETTEEVMEGKDNNKDGKIKRTFQLSNTKVSKEAGFPAVFVPEMNMLLFVVENKTMNIDFMGSESYRKDPELTKKRLIAMVKKIRGE